MFAACAPGLESLLAAELRGLGVRGARLLAAGVEFEGDAALLRRANLRLRTAERVFDRVSAFPAKSFPELIRGVARLPWERFLAPGAPIAVRVDARASKLYHERAVAERVAEGVGIRLRAKTALAKAVDDGPGPALLSVRIERDFCSILLDSSGEPLHRRGWRLATAKAPLRETLAAALVLASGWDRTAALIDPLCGSGTIAIEAALLARGLAPGRGRRFAFQDRPGFDAAAWERERAEVFPAASPRILASDRDAGAVAAARANAERAGVADAIEFSCRPLSAADAPAGAFLVTNPPYGVRVSEGKDLRALYASLGARARERAWSATLLCSSAALARATGLGFGPGTVTLNGGIPVRILTARP